MSPAIISSVVIERNENEDEQDKAIITLGSDQKSKAIGRSGINIRLASMLTGLVIELEEKDSGDLSTSNMTGSESNEKKDDISSLEALFN